MTTTKEVQEAFAKVNLPRASFNRGLMSDPERVRQYLRDLYTFRNKLREYATEHGVDVGSL